MTRVFITGDIHGEMEVNRFSSANFPEGKELTKDDYVIICGDFGLIWSDPPTKVENYWLNWLNKKPWTTLFVDGNHENHIKLNEYSLQEWHGGKVHKIRDSVFHLMRGQIFDINNRKFFTYGGAESIDKAYRVPYQSWWPQETPNMNDYNEAVCNLRANDFKVDYIITHAAPFDYLSNLFSYRAIPGGGNTTPFQLYDIKCMCEYKEWFCGHYHMDCSITKNFHIMYEKVIEINL